MNATSIDATMNAATMDATSIILKVAGVTIIIAVIGAIVRYIYVHGMEADKANILESVFGEPMHTGTFTLSEATTWLKSHFQSDCQGAILRANCAALKKYAPNVDLGKGLENYLVMVILDKSTGNMRDHVLVKFEKLDANLDKALGDEGMLVIEG